MSSKPFELRANYQHPSAPSHDSSSKNIELGLPCHLRHNHGSIPGLASSSLSISGQSSPILTLDDQSTAAPTLSPGWEPAFEEKRDKPYELDDKPLKSPRGVSKIIISEACTGPEQHGPAHAKHKIQNRATKSHDNLSTSVPITPCALHSHFGEVTFLTISSVLHNLSSFLQNLSTSTTIRRSSRTLTSAIILFLHQITTISR
jgi:hypothetical protein